MSRSGRLLGLLGGTSYPSTMLYYNRLNQLYQQKLGGFHSCPLLLYNIDYHEIKSRYHHGWDEIPELLRQELEKLCRFHPQGLIICNNTLHKAYDLISEKLPDIPVFHIVKITRDYILSKGYQKVLLLGTRFTMEDSFFKDPLRDKGISVDMPDEQDRKAIQQIQTALSQGVMQPEFETFFRQFSQRYQHYDAFILGCTELPLVFNTIQTETEQINTIELQCQEAIRFQLADI